VLSLPLVAGVMAVMGVGLFVMLDARRRVVVEPAPVAMLQAAPPLDVPPAPPPAVRVVVREVPVPVPAPAPTPARVVLPPIRPAVEAPRPVPLALARVPANRDGALVIDNTGAAAGAKPAEGGDESVRASLIRNRASVMPQGAILAAVLETPLNSDRPGLARAIITQDARGFDGSRVLIPRGSRLIGEFKADNAEGKRRVLVTWNRLIRPDGVAIRLGSPATDAMGGAGIAGSVNTHFAERFASAVLQSALSIGVNVASAELSRSGSAVFVGVPGQMAAVGQSVSAARPATVKVREGAEIAVLVARDLDFGGTPAVR
jgi:type IV secretion system protein VirB10